MVDLLLVVLRVLDNLRKRFNELAVGLGVVLSLGAKVTEDTDHRQFRLWHQK